MRHSSRASGGSRTKLPQSTPPMSTSTPASRKETIDALKEMRALSAFVPAALGGARGFVRRACGSLLRARQALRRERDGLRDASDPGRDARPARGEPALLRSIISPPRCRAAADRLGHLRSRDRRRHGQLGRRADAGRWRSQLHQAGAHRLLRRLCRRPADHAPPLARRRGRRPGARPDPRRPASLDPQGTWDPFGMRGTCSPGYVVSPTFAAGADRRAPFSEIAPQSMVPVSHILWSHLWLGIATDAFDRARAFVRAAAKRTPGATPPAATKLSPCPAAISS